MRVLIACEFSGIVREAFRARGHDAWSCDLLPTEIPGPHIQGDVLDLLSPAWDMMIAFPPCTALASSGDWIYRGSPERRDALEFVRKLLDAPIHRIALENPRGTISTQVRKPDDAIEPWHYGHPVSKYTCLWLKNLPPLRPGNIVYGPIAPFMRYKGSGRYRYPSESWKRRTRFWPGVAAAMAEQWG